MNISGMNSSELFALHSQIEEELRSRRILRSSNNPTGDLAEYLFCTAFKWEQSDNSTPNVDAIDKNGISYQIKGRRLTQHNNSRQLSAIRNLDGAHFHFLAGVLFNDDYTVWRAALIPYVVVKKLAKKVEYTNSYKFMLSNDVLDASEDGVLDVTEKLKMVKL